MSCFTPHGLDQNRAVENSLMTNQANLDMQQAHLHAEFNKAPLITNDLYQTTGQLLDHSNCLATFPPRFSMFSPSSHLFPMFLFRAKWLMMIKPAKTTSNSRPKICRCGTERRGSSNGSQRPKAFLKRKPHGRDVFFW